MHGHGHDEHSHCHSLPALAKGALIPTTKSVGRNTGCSHKEKAFSNGLRKSGKANIKSTNEEIFPKSIKRKGSKNKTSRGKKNFQAGELKRSGDKNIASKPNGKFRAGDLNRGPKDKQSTKESGGITIKRSNTMHKKGKGSKQKISIIRSGKMCQTSESLGYKSRPRGKSGVADKTKQSSESKNTSGIMRKAKDKQSQKEHSSKRKGSGAGGDQNKVSDPKRKGKPVGLTIRKDRDQNRHSPIHGPRTTSNTPKKRSKKKSSFLGKKYASHSSIFKPDDSPRAKPKNLPHNVSSLVLGDDSRK